MILALVELSGGNVGKTALTAVGAALQAKSRHGYAKVTALLVGSGGLSSAAGEIAKYGVDEVLVAEHPSFEHYLAVPFAEVVLQAAREVGATMVIGLATAIGKDLLPRVAQALEAAQVSECLAFLDSKQFRRPMYAGNLFADVEVTTPVVVVSARGSAFEPAATAGSAAPVRQLSVAPTPQELQSFVSFESVASDRPELTEAEIVVTGGRALKSAENFEKVVLPLADALGAAVGASRAAVDSGYAPNDWQVGQTGKIVAPRLYIGVGVSGAIQHLAGMKDSKVIVAINKDPEAPIFEVADYGLVGDLFEVVPELTAAVQRARGE